MEVLDQKIDALNAEIVVRIEPKDYQEQYEKALNDLKKRVNLPGFRPGKVPSSYIKKRFGGSVLAEELQKMVSDKLMAHIRERELNIIGGPLPKEDGKMPGDFENPGSFEFTYEIGLRPDFELKVSKGKYTYFRIKPEDKMVDAEIDRMRRRYGQLVDVDEAGEKDLILGDLQELDREGAVLDGGVRKENASISMEFIAEDAKKLFIGKKVGDTVEIDPLIVSRGDADMAAMLGVTKEQLPGISNRFNYTIKLVKKMNLAELSQEFFDKVFGEDKVHSEKEMREVISQEIQKSLDKESDRLFLNHITEDLVERHEINLPDSFFKRWIKVNNDNEQVSVEQIEQEYPHYANSARWQLLQDKIIKEHNLAVAYGDVVNFTMGLLASNYQSYNMPIPQPEELQKLAEDYLKNKEDEARQIGNMLFEQRLVELVRKEAKVSDKNVSLDEFQAIVSGEKQK